MSGNSQPPITPAPERLMFSCHLPRYLPLMCTYSYPPISLSLSHTHLSLSSFLWEVTSLEVIFQRAFPGWREGFVVGNGYCFQDWPGSSFQLTATYKSSPRKICTHTCQFPHHMRIYTHRYTYTTHIHTMSFSKQWLWSVSVHWKLSCDYSVNIPSWKWNFPSACLRQA